MTATDSQPLYKAISLDLEERIRRGDYAGNGGKLESENELCARHGTSRRTIRMAVEQLIAQGLIERIPGKGSYVIDTANGDSPRKNLNIAILSTPQGHQHDGVVLCDARVLNGIRNTFGPGTTFALEEYPPEPHRSDVLSRFTPQNYDGVVLFSPAVAYQRCFAQCHIPVVVFGQVAPDVALPSVTTNRFQTGYDIARKAVANGYRQVGVIAWDTEKVGVQRLVEGIRQGLADYRESWGPGFLRGAADVRGYLRHIDEMLAAGMDFLVLDGDNFCDLVHAHLLSRGVSVPGDVAIVVNEMHQQEVSRPPHFSGYATSFFDLGVHVARTLGRLIASPETRGKPRPVMLDVEFTPGRTMRVLPRDDEA